MVPRGGLEPPHPKALAPHASVSTNFTISAIFLLRITVAKATVTEESRHHS